MVGKFLAFSFAFAIAGGTSNAAEVYFNDFEGGLALTGAGGIEGVQGYEGVNGISGNFFRNDSVGGSSDLNLSGLGSHSELLVEFDLALIDSWDGPTPSTFGPDFFNVLVDGVEEFETSSPSGVSPSATDEMFGAYGFNVSFNDAAYRVSFSLAHVADGVAISFFADGAGYQGGIDESWAIDNLRVTTRGGSPGIVPIPSALPLLLSALGLSGIAVQRRRRRQISGK